MTADELHHVAEAVRQVQIERADRRRRPRHARRARVRDRVRARRAGRNAVDRAQRRQRAVRVPGEPDLQVAHEPPLPVRQRRRRVGVGLGAAAARGQALVARRRRRLPGDRSVPVVDGTSSTSSPGVPAAAVTRSSTSCRTWCARVSWSRSASATSAPRRCAESLGDDGRAVARQRDRIRG